MLSRNRSHPRATATSVVGFGNSEPADGQIQRPSVQSRDLRSGVCRTAPLKGDGAPSREEGRCPGNAPSPLNGAVLEPGASFGEANCVRLNLRISLSLLPKLETRGTLRDPVNGYGVYCIRSVHFSLPGSR